MSWLPSSIIFLLLGFTYLLGSVPVGFLLVRKFKPQGARVTTRTNLNADHVRILAGWRLGGLTLLLNVFKGVLAVYAAKSFDFSVDMQALAGFFAVLGHCFPIWLRFAGGKGASTGFGVLIALSPTAALCTLIVFVVSLFITKTLSVSALLGSLGAFMSSVIFLAPKSTHIIILAAVILVFLRHYQNIQRFIAGTEPLWRQIDQKKD